MRPANPRSEAMVKSLCRVLAVFALVPVVAIGLVWRLELAQRLRHAPPE